MKMKIYGSKKEYVHKRLNGVNKHVKSSDLPHENAQYIVQQITPWKTRTVYLRF